jgi:hypothetical protein
MVVFAPRFQVDVLADIDHVDRSNSRDARIVELDRSIRSVSCAPADSYSTDPIAIDIGST